MKKELLFAVALLATGCLLCFSQFTDPSKLTTSNQLTSIPSSQSNGPTPNGISLERESRQSIGDGRLEQSNLQHDVGVVQAGFPENMPTGSSENVLASYQVSDASKTQLGSNAAPRPANQPPLEESLYVHQVSSPRAVSFLSDVAKQISNSRPMGSSLELTGNLFGQAVSATGNYYQMGQGSHKSRIELSFGTEPDSPTVIQLCDGRFVYKLQTYGNEHSLEFVDLLRVKQTAGERGIGITPTGWVASGGIAGLFQHLASAFNFGEIESVDGSGVLLRGSWDVNALRQIAGVDFNLDSSAENRVNIWSQVPRQLPHAVELVFRRDEDQNYFPKRIRFLKFVQPDRDKEVETMVVMEFAAPHLLANVSDRYFVVDSTNLESVDITEQYIARINNFDQLQQTAAANESVDR